MDWSSGTSTKTLNLETEPEDIEVVPDEAVPDEEAVPMEHEVRPTVCVDKEEYERMKSEIEALRE